MKSGNNPAFSNVDNSEIDEFIFIFQVTQSPRDLQYSAYNDVTVDMETPAYDSPPSYEDVCSDVTQNNLRNSILYEPPPKYEDIA